MHHRHLAAAIATATVAATPALAPIAAGATSTSSFQLHLDTGVANMPDLCQITPPTFDPSPLDQRPALIASVNGFKGGTCPDGTVAILYSFDHVHWKSIASGAVYGGSGTAEAHLPQGQFWYQSYYVTADNTAWGSTDSTSPTRIKC
jgi:hypothetical protein